MIATRISPTALKVEPQPKLYSSRASHGKYFSKERTKVRIRPRYSPVRVVKGIEQFGTEFERSRFLQNEPAMDCQIDNTGSGTGDDIAPGITKREGLRCLE